MKRIFLVLALSGFLFTMAHAEVLYGLKSRSNNTGGAGEYLTPATLFAFQADGSQFVSIGAVTKNGVQIRADALAYSAAAGLWCFEPTSTSVSTLYRLDPASAMVISDGIVFNNRQIFGAAFDRRGQLWAIDQTSDELLRIDLASGSLRQQTPLTCNGTAFNLDSASGDICFDAQGRAFLVHYNGIYRLNPLTGVLTELFLDTTGYAKFLVGAAVPAELPEMLAAFDITMTAIDNDDVFIYMLPQPAAPSCLFNSILNSYNAGRGDLATAIPAELTVSSDFAADADGWTGAGLSVANISQIVQSLTITYLNGAISLEDQDSLWTTFAAPAKYLGDKADWLGGEISFEMRHQTGGTPLSGSMIFLVSGGTVLCSPWLLPDASWQHYAFSLTPDGWHTDTPQGPEPSLATLYAVLADLDGLYIVADYVSGTETTTIDQVRLVSGLSPDTQVSGWIDLHDFACFALQWLRSDCTEPDHCQGQDFNKDGQVEFYDLHFLLVNWLQEVH